MEDHLLIEMLVREHTDAFRLIFGKYYPLIYTFMLRQCASEEDAKDLAQDTFIKLWSSRKSLSEGSTLKAYLFTVAKNIFIDYLRKKVNRRVYEKISENMAVLNDIQGDEQELLNLLYKYASNMPPKQMEVFRLRWMEGLSRKEIAERMGISIVTVDIHIRKAVGYLKGKVGENKLMYLCLFF